MTTERPTIWSVPFVVAAASNFLTGVALFLYVHLPGVLERWGADEVVVGVAAGSMAAGALLVRPFVGGAMDGRGGRRAVLVVGGLGHVVACAGYLAVDGIGPLFWAVRVLHGLSEGALFAALFTTAADLVPPARRTEGLALFGVSGMLPVAISGFLGDAVVARGGYEALFALGLAFATAGFLVSLALPETGRRAAEGAGVPVRPTRGFFAVLSQADLMPIWLAGVSFAGALGVAYAFLKTYVEAEGVGSVGLFYGWYSLAAIALRLSFGWVPDRYGPKRVLLPAMLAIGVALALVSAARTDLHVAIAGALAGLGHGYAFPILSGLTAGRARHEERGSAMSLFTAVFDAGILVAGPSFGWIAHATSLRTMFLAAAGVPIAGALLFYAWDARALRALRAG